MSAPHKDANDLFSVANPDQNISYYLLVHINVPILLLLYAKLFSLLSVYQEFVLDYYPEKYINHFVLDDFFFYSLHKWTAIY